MDVDDFAALQQLRRSADTLFGAIAGRLAEACRRSHEAEERRAEAQLAQEAWEVERTALREAMEDERELLALERKALDEEKANMADPKARKSDVLSLNVGGERVVQRRRSTLCSVEDSFLAARFSGRWEHELDRDPEGRYFINYPPELFLPLLDYLGTKETEDPSKELTLPRGPEQARPQFQAMLRFFGMLQEVSVLDAVSVPYKAAMACEHGLAFEIMPRKFSLFLVGLETSAGTSTVGAAVSASVYVCQGTLLRRLRQKDEWRLAGSASLKPGRATRIELTEPVFLQANTMYCIYIATAAANGIALGEEARCNEVVVQNDDLEIHSGRTSGSATHFNGFEGFIYWFTFNGKLEYTLTEGL